MAKKVTQTEKEKMWKLYQQYGSFKKVAEKMRRCPDTVSRHVREYEIAIATAGHILNSTNRAG